MDGILLTVTIRQRTFTGTELMSRELLQLSAITPTVLLVLLSRVRLWRSKHLTTMEADTFRTLSTECFMPSITEPTLSTIAGALRTVRRFAIWLTPHMRWVSSLSLPPVTLTPKLATSVRQTLKMD